MIEVSGNISVKISFERLDVEDDSEGAILDALFPDGWFGELTVKEVDAEFFDV